MPTRCSRDRAAALWQTPAIIDSLAILQRAEQAFERPRFVHLVRHPYAVLRSFVEFLQHGEQGAWSSGATWAGAEDYWLHGNRNAASHLWLTFLLDRASFLATKTFLLLASGFCAIRPALRIS